MFEKLDDVNWASLEHAYGAAGDIPQHLRNLISPSPKTSARAMDALYGNIWHQGTVYAASAPAGVSNLSAGNVWAN